MHQEAPKSSRREKIIRWGGSILSVVLLAYLFSRQGWTEIAGAFRGLTIPYLAAALGLIILSRFAVVFRWHVLLNATEQKIKPKDTIRLTFAGLFASNFLATTIGGDVVRLGGAYQMGYDSVVAAASLVVDRLIGLTGMAMAVPFGIGPLLVWFRDNPGGIASVQVFGNLWGKGRRLFARGLDALSLWYRRPGYLLGSLLFTFVHMGSLFGMISLFLVAMDDPLPLNMIAGLWSFVYLVTLLPISINGYGVQELSTTFMFTQVGGLAPESGLAIAVLVRTMTILVSLPGAIFLPSILAANRQQKTDHQPGVASEQASDPQENDT